MFTGTISFWFYRSVAIQAGFIPYARMLSVV